MLAQKTDREEHTPWIVKDILDKTARKRSPEEEWVGQGTVRRNCKRGEALQGRTRWVERKTRTSEKGIVDRRKLQPKGACNYRVVADLE